MKTKLKKAQIGKIVKTVTKTATKTPNKSKINFTTKATKDEIAEAFKRMERKDLKAKLQALEKAGKKMQDGGYVPSSYQTTGTPKAGGAILNKKSSTTPIKRSISENAAKRKVAKGKGMISYKMGDKTAPGSSENKGQYIGFSKQARKDYKSGKTIGINMTEAKAARTIKKMGGNIKKK
jgi:hypothetical protein